ncbi:hypothetical protein VR611_08880, partial [Aquirufa nivalisilvae]
MQQRITKILFLLCSGKNSLTGKSTLVAFWGLFLFTLNFNLIAQRSFSPVAASYSNAAVMPFAQDIFVNHTDSLDYTLAKKRILKAKNGVDFHLRSFFTKSDYQDQLFKFFPGKHKQMDASFIEKAESLKNLVLGNGLYVPIQFVKWENMHGAMASYSSIGPDGRPRIYINKEYSEGQGNFLYPDATDMQLISLLFQEYGHAIDDYLNGLDDSPGDEGDLFAVRVLKLDVTERYVETVLVRNDHNKIKVDGKDIFVEDAGVYLLEAWPATTASGGGTTWTTGAAKSTNTPLRLETSTISSAWNVVTGSISAIFWDGGTSISGTVNFQMTGATPANSVLGFLTGGSGTAGYLLELPNSTTTLAASTGYTFANGSEGTTVQGFSAAIGTASTLTLSNTSRGAGVTTTLTAQAKTTASANTNGITATFSSTSGTASITGTNPGTTAGSGGNTGKAAVTVSDTKSGTTVFNCELKNSVGWYVVETASLTVTPGTATKLNITGTGTQTAGTSQTITITAQDTYGNTATTYTGAKNLTFSGATSSPAPVTNPTAQNSSAVDIAFGSTTAETFSAGVATSLLKLYDAETATIAVTDGTLSSTGADNLSIVVSPSTMTKLSTSIATPQTNAVAFTGTNTLTALDAYGNIATSFNASTNNITVSNTLGGTVSSLGSGANNVLNQAGDFTSGVADLTAQGMTYTGTSGTGTFTFTPASGTAITSGSIVVNPGAATKLVITGTSTQTAGNSQNITLTAYDVSGNVATSYTGDKTLTFSGANVSTNPATNPNVTDKNTTAINFGTGTVITFTNGVASSVPMSLYKAESAVVAVTDGSISAAGADRLTVAVSAAAFNKLAVNLTSPQTNGTAFTGTNTLTAQDAYGNTVTTFAANTNNVTVTSTLTGAVSGLGSGVNNVLNQAGDFVSGVANLTSLGLKFTGTSGAGTFTFTPTSGTAAVSSSLTVNPGAATKLAIDGSTSFTAGAGQTIAIIAQDASGNIASSYTGAKNITLSGAANSSSPSTSPTFGGTNFGSPHNITFISGSASATMVLYKAEVAAINASDGTINSNTGGTLNVTVSASTMTKLAVSLTSPQINGTAFTGTNTLTAQDAYGNTVTTFAANTNNVTVTTSLTGTVSGLGSGVNNVLNQAGDFVSGVANLTSLGLKFTGTSGAGTFTFTPASGTAATSSSITVSPGAATRLVVTGTGTQTAGASNSITITAKDVSGNTVTTYTGSKNLTFSGATSSTAPVTTPKVTNSSATDIAFGTATALTFASGTVATNMKLYNVESAVVAVTDGSISAAGADRLTVAVSASTMTKLAVSLTSPQINGTAFTGTNTLTAQDAYGNTVTTFAANTNNVTVTTSLTGTVSGLGSGVNNVLNQAGDFVSGVANLTSLGLKFTGTSGAGTFTFTPASGTAATSSSITVSPGAATRLVVTGTGTQTAGASNSITITAKDVSGNTVTTYTGSKNLTFSGATSSTAPVTTPKVTNSSATDIAFGTATALTFASGTVTTNMKLYNVESAVVAVTDGSISAAGADRLTVAVSASTMTKLAVSLTSPQINGTAFTGTNTLTAQDAYGNTVTTFAANTNNVTVTTSLTGTVSGLGSGVNHVLNQAGDFVSGVANLTSLGLKFTGTSGAGTFTFTPVSGTAATSSSITVNPGAATRLVVTGTGTQTAGASNSITITAKDASGNTVTTYTGSKNLTFSGATSSSSPVTTPKVTNSSATDIAFGTATALTFASGAVTTNMKLYNVESAVVAVTDGSISAAGADRLTVAVSASTMTKLAVSLTSPQINGTAFTGTNTLTAQDAYGNTVTTFAANTNNVTVTTSLTGTVSGLGSGVNNVLNQAGDFVSGVANLTSLGLKFTGTSGAGTFTFTPASGTAATSSSVTVNPGAATKLAVTGTGTQTAGGSQTVTVTAQDASGNTVTTYTGAKNITFSGAAASPSPATTPTVAGTNFGTATSLTFTAGVATGSMILYKAESATVNATDGTINSNTGGTLNVTVSPSTMTKLAVSLTSPQINGTAFTGTNTLTALDAYGNTATGFSAAGNNITVTTTLTGAITGLSGTNKLSSAGDFTSGVANLTSLGLTFTGTTGAGTFTFTPVSGTAITSSSVTVNSGAATKLVVTGTGTQTAGGSQTVTVTAKDASGNTVTTYTGAKNITFSGATASSSPVTNPTVAATNFGTATSLTFTAGVATGSMVLYKAESATVNATDGTINSNTGGTLNVTVSPSTMTKLAVSLTSPQINGTAFTGTNTLTAQDAYGNTVTTFAANTNNVTVTTSLTGTISGLGSGVNNVLNQAGDFVSGVANLTSLGLKFTGTSGAGTFTFTPASGTAATSSSVTVNSGAATKLVVTGTGTQTAGGSQTVTVTAKDASGNTVTTYTGAKNITFSGATASPSPATTPTVAATNFGTATSLTFTAGVATGSMVLYKAESATVNATDGTINSNTGGTLNVTVSPSTMTKLAVSLATPQINGTAFTGTNTLTAQDAYGNTATGFNASTNNITVTSTLTGTISGLGSGVNNVLNQAGDFSSGVADLTALGMTYTGTSGSGTFTFTPASGTAITSSSRTISPGAATKLVITGSATQTAAASNSITITAKDVSGNTATTYTGTKSLTFSGANASSNPSTTPKVTDSFATDMSFGSATNLSFTSGAVTTSMKLYKAESALVAATDGTISAAGADRLSVSVSASAMTKLAVSLASPQINGTAFTGTNTLTAQDAYGNTVTTFAANTNNVTVTTSLTGTVSGLGSGVNNVLNQAGDFVSGVANLTSLGLKFTGTSGAGTFTFTPASGTAIT